MSLIQPPGQPCLLKSQIAIGSRVSLPWRSQKKIVFFLLQGRGLLKEEEEKNTCLPIYLYLRHWYTHILYTTDGSPDRLSSYYFNPEHSGRNEIFSRILQHAKKRLRENPPPPIHDIRKRHQKHNVRLAGPGWQSAGQGGTVSFTAVRELTA